MDTSDTHPTVISMKLDKEKNQLDRLGIVVSDKDKLQFYLEQIYTSNCFDKAEMVVWENKPVAIKEDYDQAKKYFEDLIHDFETYTQNSGGAAAKAGYKRANQMANVGDEIRKYIQDIASATVADKEQTAKLAANVHESERIKDAQIAAMMAQIKMLADAMTVLTKLIENKETNAGHMAITP